MKALGAVFGVTYGWERPNFFAPPGYALDEADLAKPDVLLNENHAEPAPGETVREKWSFRRSNYFEFVGGECRQVNEKVGLLDMSAFAKTEVSGPGAAAWLELAPHQSLAESARPRHAHLSAHALRRRQHRVHAHPSWPRALLSRFRRRPGVARLRHLAKARADRRQRAAGPGDDAKRRVGAGRAKVARDAGQGHRLRPRQCRLPLAFRAPPQRRRRRRDGAAREFRRRARL